MGRAEDWPLLKSALLPTIAQTDVFVLLYLSKVKLYIVRFFFSKLMHAVHAGLTYCAAEPMSLMWFSANLGVYLPFTSGAQTIAVIFHIVPYIVYICLEDLNVYPKVGIQELNDRYLWSFFWYLPVLLCGLYCCIEQLHR